MADVNIVIGAKDMATQVMKSVSVQTSVMASSVNAASRSVVASTQTMAAGFTSLAISVAPLLAAMLSLQAIFAVFKFGTESVKAFVEAGSPAGQALGASLQVASTAVNKLMQSIGGLLAPLVGAAANGLTMFANIASELLAPAIEYLSTTFAQSGPIVQGFLQAIIGAVTGAEVAFGNLGPIMEYAWLAFKLSFAQMIEGTKHTFTEVLPAYIKWFSENAFNLVRDAAVGMSTVLMNFGRNLGEFGAAVYMWVSSGMKDGLDGLMNNLGQTMMVGLLNGFEAQTSALPQIAQRQATEYEKALSGEMNRIGTNLGDQFNEKFKARVAGIGQALAVPGVSPTAAEQPVNKLATSLSSVADSQATIAQQLQATESRLLTRGQVDSPMQSVAAASAKTAVAVEKTQTASERMVTLLEELLGKNFVIAEKV